MKSLRVLPGLALLCAACGAAAPSVGLDASAPPADAAVANAARLELGTGQSAWQDLPPTGGSFGLVMGPQGGYHLYGRVRFAGLAPDVNVSFRVMDHTVGTVFNNPTTTLHRRERMGLVASGDGWESTSAELVILTTIRAPSEVAGHVVCWEATVQELGTGITVQATRVGTVLFP